LLHGVNKEVVVEAEVNAEITKVDTVVVAVTTEKMNTQEMDQVQMTIVLFMVDISGANATRILAEIIIILQEEVAKMDKDVVIPIQAVVIMVEVAEAIGIHYKMDRHRTVPGLCFFGLRSVSVTQFGCAVCVSAGLCQTHSIRQRTVFLCVTPPTLIANDRSSSL
jgi:uncharacterized protein YtpQ (UPF0354 family)